MKLVAYNSSEGGGMMGGRSSLSIKYAEDGRCKVEASDKIMHNQPTTYVTYYSDGLLDKLSELCERYNVISWINLLDSNMFMHDAPTVNRSFTFEDGTIVDLGSKKMFPEGASDMLYELKDIVKEAENNGQDKVVTTKDENAFMGMGMMNMMAFQNANNAPVTTNQDFDSTKWTKFCENCGTKFEGSMRFCSECGTPRKKLEE